MGKLVYQIKILRQPSDDGALDVIAKIEQESNDDILGLVRERDFGMVHALGVLVDKAVKQAIDNYDNYV